MQKLRNFLSFLRGFTVFALMPLEWKSVCLSAIAAQENFYGRVYTDALSSVAKLTMPEGVGEITVLVHCRHDPERHVGIANIKRENPENAALN